MFSFKPDKDDPFKIRRMFAIQSFYLIVLLFFFVLLFVVYGKPEMIDRLNAAQFIFAALITALTANFAHYTHSVYKTKCTESNTNGNAS